MTPPSAAGRPSRPAAMTSVRVPESLLALREDSPGVARSLGHVAEDHDDADDPPAVVPDRRGAVLDGRLGAVAGDQDGVVGQADDDPLADDPVDRVLGRLPGLLVDDPEDLLDRPARRLSWRPAGERLGDRVEEPDPALAVGGDDRVADARQRRRQPLLARGAGAPRPASARSPGRSRWRPTPSPGGSSSESGWRANIAQTPTSRSSTTSGYPAKATIPSRSAQSCAGPAGRR